jgi:phosphatidate cytidylyltransferase
MSVYARPAQLWCLPIGFFSSIVGPFGGFLASGIKRAYGLKDFANTMPGHGGFTDRFDCLIFMVGFMATLMQSFIYR